MASVDTMPVLHRAHTPGASSPGIPAITQSLTEIRDLIEMYRRQLNEGQIRRKLVRWANRLTKIAAEINALDGTGE
jgi:hypothetical protein